MKTLSTLVALCGERRHCPHYDLNVMQSRRPAHNRATCSTQPREDVPYLFTEYGYRGRKRKQLVLRKYILHSLWLSSKVSFAVVLDARNILHIIRLIIQINAEVWLSNRNIVYLCMHSSLHCARSCVSAWLCYDHTRWRTSMAIRSDRARLWFLHATETQIICTHYRYVIGRRPWSDKAPDKRVILLILAS